MEAKDVVGLFIEGQRDCDKGIPARSNDPDYLRGYAAQYELEQVQAWQTEQKEQGYVR